MTASDPQAAVLRTPFWARVPARAASLRAPVGVAAMALLVLCALQIATRAAAHRGTLIPAARKAGYPGWMRGPLQGLTDKVMNGHDFAIYLIVMAGLYLVALACASALRPAWVAAAAGTLIFVMFLAPPVLSADVFGYIDFARAGAVHHLNPYVHAAGSVHSDAVHPFVRWHHGSTPYGPVFTLLSYGVGGLTVSAALWVFKLVALLGGLGLVALVWACARVLDRPLAPALALVGLNPMLSVYAVGGAHNDLLMLTVAFGGVLMLLRGKVTAAGGTLMAAVGLKASALALVPFAVLGTRARTRFVTALLVTLGALVVLAVGAFGTHGLGFLKVLGGQQRLVATSSVPKQLSVLLGFDGLPAGMRVGAIALFALVVVVTLVRTARGADWIAGAAWSTFALLVASAWLLPWYVCWLLPLAALAGTRRLTAAAAAFTVYLALVRGIPLL